MVSGSGIADFRGASVKPDRLRKHKWRHCNSAAQNRPRPPLGATYRSTEGWAMTLVGHYQSKISATLDNNDVVHNSLPTEQGSVSFGIDNIGNAKYHLFHPIPQRTSVVEGKLKL
jgi:hypothetical protein